MAVKGTLEQQDQMAHGVEWKLGPRVYKLLGSKRLWVMQRGSRQGLRDRQQPQPSSASVACSQRSDRVHARESAIETAAGRHPVVFRMTTASIRADSTLLL